MPAQRGLEPPSADAEGRPADPNPVGLSVVVPAFNEEERLGASLERILTYLEDRGGSFEVLVADDGSADRTSQVAESFASRGVRLIRLEQNRGKGAALKRGVGASRGDRVLLTDADLSTPIEDLAKLEPHLAEHDLVFGSRAVASSDITVRQPFYREWMGKIFNRIIRLSGVRGLRDTQCGFKLLRGGAARDLFEALTVERFAFDVELVVLARRRGYSLTEVGVAWANSPASRVNPIKDSLSMLFDVARIRWRHRGR